MSTAAGRPTWIKNKAAARWARFPGPPGAASESEVTRTPGSRVLKRSSTRMTISSNRLIGGHERIQEVVVQVDLAWGKEVCFLLHMGRGLWCTRVDRPRVFWYRGPVCLLRPRGEKDITQVSGTCSPRSIRGGGIFSPILNLLSINLP